MIDFKKAPLHPTNEELADFIDNRVIGTRKQEIEEHLLFCDDCMGVVAEVKRVSKDNKDINSSQVANVDNQEITPQGGGDVGLGYANNWLYNGRVRAIILSGLVASVVVIFMLSPFSSTQFNIGDIDLSKPIMTTMSSSPKYQNRVVDGDKVVKEIEESLDKTALSNFKDAQKAEAQKSYNKAIELYRKSFRDAIQTFEGREKLKWQIVIYYHISKIKFERNDEDSSSYTNRVQFWIQKYVLGE